MEQEILDYILEAQKHGLTEFEIKQNLLNAGWEAEVIEQSFVFAKAQESKPQAVATKDTAARNSFAVPEHGQVHNTPGHLSEKSFITTDSPAQSIFKKPLLWIIAVVLLVASGGAYAYYSFVLKAPEKAWEKFAEKQAGTVFSSKFSASYIDAAETGKPQDTIFGELSQIKLQFSGNGFVDNTDPDNVNSKSDIKYTFSTGGLDVSLGFDYILKNNIFYLNVGDNPFLSGISENMNDGKKISWIKFDLNEIKKEIENDPTSSSSDTALVRGLFDQTFKQELEKIWNDSRVIKQDAYLGQEIISGQKTFHFKNSVDKSALKNLVAVYSAALGKQIKASGDDSFDEAMTNELGIQLIDKLEVKEFETWIGKNDYNLYKVKFKATAPSLISLMNAPGVAPSFSSSRDAKRLADVRMMASALELYYNDNNGYPAGIKGIPVDLAPDYIMQIPVAPETEGDCTDYFNGYWYKPVGPSYVVNGKTLYGSYQMTFCLGNDTNGYKKGIAKLTEYGIQDNITCPEQDQSLCYNTIHSVPANLESKVAEMLKPINFSAELNLDFEYSDYGAKAEVTEPTEFFNIIDSLNSARSKSADAKRMADVRQLASALELYFNDKNEYPKNLDILTPNYIGLVPVAPEPTSSVCTPTDNAYTYKRINQSSYTLTFCLGNRTGGYEAGKRTLTQAGIQ